MKKISTRIARGVYWLGDPAHCFPATDWKKIEEMLQAGPGPQYVIGKGTAVIFNVGRRGDFKDKDGNHYLVRSGFIGAVPFTIAPIFPENTNLLKHFKEEHFDCHFKSPFINFDDQVIIDLG